MLRSGPIVGDWLATGFPSVSLYRSHSVYLCCKMSDREREVVAEFIELYRDLPCLWDIGSEAYKDSKQKSAALELLAKKLKEIEPDANTASVKKKIGNLKTAYKREARRVKESKMRTAYVPNEVHRPLLWYYDLMTFLDKKDEHQQSGADSLTSDDESHQSEQSATESSSKRKGTIVRGWEQKRQKLLEIELGPEQRMLRKSNSFGIYVGEQLEQISTYQRQVAEKVIAEVIFLAKTENLSFDSRVETPSRSRPFAFASQSTPRVPSPQYHCIQLSPSYVTRSPSPPSVHSRPAKKDAQASQYQPSFHSVEIKQPPPSP